ncbi:hypothetical protein CcaverHIS002_0105840 [Cutaneotrichosporon cavernicola]|nr:hypothetical protein CcaverHIS002_0105840 [Cutaneotrichosporon cavernicola]
MSATTPSTSTTTAWTSAVHHSQHLQPERTPLRNRPPFTPVSPPTQLKDPRRDPSPSPAPGGFNGWESATLYYHAIHRLPPLSSWCGTVLEMALKSCDTWVVSRHANDLPSYARIMAFYGGERGEPPSSRATSEKGSIKGVGSASASASDVSRSDPEAVLAGEIVTVGAFARRMETVIDALQTQMAPYDLTMPRTHLVGAWREIGERITARSNAERRREGSSRHTASEESESTRAEKSARTRKRRREREDGPVTGILPVLIGRDWIVAAADTVTGLVLIYDAGHALDATEADIVRDEVMRAVAETIGQEPMRVEVRHLRPPDRVPQRHTVLLACAALEMFGSSPAPIGDRSLPVYLGLWSKLLAQGITLAIPPVIRPPLCRPVTAVHQGYVSEPRSA